MKKIYLLLFFMFTFPLSIFSNEDIIKQADKLDIQGKNKEALYLLIDNFDKTNPDPGIIYRIGFQSFEAANNTNNKKEKILLLDIGIEMTYPYLNINSGSNRDRAEIVHWYAINYAVKNKILGLFSGKNGLTLIPEVFKLLDKAIALDPGYAGGYYSKGKMYEEIPVFLGGSKVKMEINYIKTIKNALEKEKIVLFVNIARSFYKRNWDSRKKIQKNNIQDNIFDSDYLEKSDNEFAYELILKSIELYKKKKNKSVREEKVHKEANELKKLLNKRIKG